MSEHEIDPLEPELRAILEVERSQPDMPREAAERVLGGSKRPPDWATRALRSAAQPETRPAASSADFWHDDCRSAWRCSSSAV